MTDEIKLPEPDTASMAYSGRSVDYINGYEAGYEAAADQVRAAVLEATMAERERCAKVCEELALTYHDLDGTYPAGKKTGSFACAAAIRAGHSITECASQWSSRNQPW